MLKIRRFRDCLIFNMGIPCLGISKYKTVVCVYIISSWWTYVVYLSLFFRDYSLALGQWYDWPSANNVTQKKTEIYTVPYQTPTKHKLHT